MKSTTPHVGWTFLTNHALVLLQIWRSPEVSVRTIAERVEITERATFRILAELVAAGYVSRRRVGRNNIYFVHRELRMRHPQTAHVGIEKLLESLEVVQG